MSTADGETKFSSMKEVKSKLSNRMSNNKLNTLEIILEILGKKSNYFFSDFCLSFAAFISSPI